MLLVRTRVKESEVHGLGLFADEFIPEGTEIWRFTPGFDLKFTRDDILAFPEALQIYLCKYAWHSKKTGLYCLSSDNGKHFNHSNDPNARSEYRDAEEEVVTVAVKEINSGEEIFDDYSSFEEAHCEENVLEEIAAKNDLGDDLDPRRPKSSEKLALHQ